MKKFIIIGLIAAIAITGMILVAPKAQAWTTLTTYAPGTGPSGRTPSGASDTFGWYSTSPATIRNDLFWKFSRQAGKGQCSLTLDTRSGSGRDSMINFHRVLMAVADSSDTVHQYTMWVDSLNIVKWRVIVYSIADSSYNYIFGRSR